MKTNGLKNQNYVQKIKSVVLVIGLGLLLIPFSASGETVSRVKMGAFDYIPFYAEENGIIEGIATDVAGELFRQMNLEAETAMYPLKRLLHNLEKGETDAVMILIKTPEREKYLHFTVPVITVRGLIWSAADRKGGAVEFEKLEDLKSYRIGVTLGYSYGAEFDSLLKTMPYVDTANADILNYKKLAAGRIDIFPGNEIVAKGIFKKNPEFKGKFVHSRKSFIEWPLHMGISRKSGLAGQLSEINRILSELKEKGFVDNAVIKYTE